MQTIMDLTTYSDQQLTDLVSAIQTEIDRRLQCVVPATPTVITARVEWDNYNDRRYSRPWIARISGWPVGGQPEMVWGNYLGNSQGGVCEVECKDGDLIRYGQKDNRGGATVHTFAVAVADTRFIVDQATAATYFRATSQRRAELIETWKLVRAEKQALTVQREAMLDKWRADINDRASYKEADRIDRKIKSLTYSA